MLNSYIIFIFLKCKHIPKHHFRAHNILRIKLNMLLNRGNHFSQDRNSWVVVTHNSWLTWQWATEIIFIIFSILLSWMLYHETVIVHCAYYSNEQGNPIPNLAFYQIIRTFVPLMAEDLFQFNFKIHFSFIVKLNIILSFDKWW